MPSAPVMGLEHATLVGEFEKHFAISKTAETRADLHATLFRVVVSARAAWTSLADFSTAEYFAFLARHLPATTDPIRSLQSLRTSDMYLVAACLQGDPRAFQIFDRHCFSESSPALQRLRFPREVVDDACQALREQFFLNVSGPSAKLGNYGGLGDLRLWVRAALIRVAWRLMRQPPGKVDVDDNVLDVLASPAGQLELDYLKRTYGPWVKEAIANSFSKLEHRDRNLLRQHYGFGLELEELARFYRVHRVTIWRWILHTKSVLLNDLRDDLSRRFALASDELASLVTLMHSQLESGLRGLWVR